MDDVYFESKLKAAALELGLNIEFRHFNQSCHSVEEAVAAVGAPREDFVKNIGLCDASGNLVICIVKGEDKVDRDAAARIVGVDKLKTAPPDLMLEKTGYPVGGTPSFGYSAHFLVDERVMEKKYVWSGGGSEHALVKIATAEMIKANHATICRIRK